MEPIKIIGGRSLSHRIAFISETYVAEARCNKTGKITTSIRPLPKFIIVLLRVNHFIPETLRMFAFVMGLMSPKMRILLIFYLSFGLYLQIKMKDIETAISDRASLSILLPLLALELAFFVGAFVFVRRLASWHGAEHMTIAAYERTRSIEIKDIESDSPIHPKCGGRLALPLFLVSGIAVALSKEFDISAFVFAVPLFEIILWIDKLKGFDKIPLFSQASKLLQRYFTTKKPGKLEIETAQAAI